MTVPMDKMPKWPAAADLLPKTPADIVGAVGSAWRCDLSKVITSNSEAIRSLNVCAWIIHAPYAHPVWHSYCLNAIALRDVEGVPPAHISLPGATHEFFLMALDPDPEGGRTYELDKPFPYLTPPNFVAQVWAASDEEMAKWMEATVRDVVDGKLNPDTDYIQHWIARFGASNIKGDPAKAGETRIHAGGVEIVIPPVPAPKNGGTKQ